MAFKLLYAVGVALMVSSVLGKDEKVAGTVSQPAASAGPSSVDRLKGIKVMATQLAASATNKAGTLAQETATLVPNKPEDAAQVVDASKQTAEEAKVQAENKVKEALTALDTLSKHADEEAKKAAPSQGTDVIEQIEHTAENWKKSADVVLENTEVKVKEAIKAMNTLETELATELKTEIKKAEHFGHTLIQKLEEIAKIANEKMHTFEEKLTTHSNPTAD